MEEVMCMSAWKLWDFCVSLGIEFRINDSGHLDIKLPPINLREPPTDEDIAKAGCLFAATKEIDRRLDSFVYFANFRLRKLAGNPITEQELMRLPKEIRAEMPSEMTEDILRATKEQLEEQLTIEGWECVGVNQTTEIEAGETPPEIWRREVSGQEEWVELWHLAPWDIRDEPERCWMIIESRDDPRFVAIVVMKGALLDLGQESVGMFEIREGQPVLIRGDLAPGVMEHISEELSQNKPCGEIEGLSWHV